MIQQDFEDVVKIIGDDSKYYHFIDRIKKDFNDSNQKGIPVAINVHFVKEGGENIGFCILSLSPLKMKQWEKTFKEEGWVDRDFYIDVSSFELMYLYIKPYFRSKGWGSKLFNQVLDYAKKTNIKSIYAFVSDTNKNSFNFYKSRGADIIYSTSDEKGSNLSAFLMWNVK